jgi:gamma-tubulin complex component 5
MYQRTFRLLLQIYRAKYLLRNTIFFREKDTPNGLATFLKQQLQWLVDTFSSHFLYAVIQPLSAQMRHAMPLARDLDEMIGLHDKFISSLQTQCLLSKNLAPIFQAMQSILELAVQFCDCRRQQIGLRPRHGQSSNGTVSNKSRRKSAVRHKQRSRVVDDTASSDESSVESNTEDAYEADTETLTTPQGSGSHIQQMVRMKEELDKTCSFMLAGLRGIGRAGGEGTWEMFADRLDWKRGTDDNVST